jgi:glycosyltransferase involved in cell wall biosynthesis
MSEYRYSIAIRTLGKGGEKYIKELNSIVRQTIQPEKVIVYIAEGYKIPDVRIGKEEYIFVKKGMVAQRALDYKEIDSPNILLLDDDVYLPDNAVEIMTKELTDGHADVIAADTFHPQTNTFWGVIRDWLSNLTYPHFSDKWAFKVLRNASCSYNARPNKPFYLSQSAAGPASLWRKETLISIHFKDELWLDNMGFAWGDDQLMFYKAYLNGFKLMVSYDSGIVHLNAKTASSVKDVSSDRWMRRAMCQYLIWYRSCYSVNGVSQMEKLLRLLSFVFKVVQGLFVHLCYSILKLHPAFTCAYLKGILLGYKYAKNSLRFIPNFVIR